MAQSDTALVIRDRYFFNATPWHRATLLSQSATAHVASVSVLFRSKERGTRVKDRAKNGVSKRAGKRGLSVAQSDTALSVRERNLVPGVLSYPPYGARERAGRREPWERGCRERFFF